MSNKIPISAGSILTFVLALLVLYFSILQDFLLFHVLAESFSVVIAFGIFIVAWNTKHLQKNNYLLFLGIAFLFIGFIDLAHTWTYKGMTIFYEQDADTPTQLWIIGRYMQSLTLLIAPVFFDRKMKPSLVIIIYGLLTTLFLLSVHKDIFPACYVEGIGLTPFKKISEYIISVILVSALVMLYTKKDRFTPGIFKLLTISIVLNICSELAFTFYINVYGLSNIIGHYLKFISFYLVYKALVETGMKDPYKFLFKDLADSEQKYRALFANMLNGFAFHKVVLDEKGKPVDLIFLEVNDSFEILIGMKRKDVIGKKVTEVFQGIQKGSYDFIAEFCKVAMTGNTLYTEQFFEVTNHWYSFSVYSPQNEYVAVIFEDITERKEAEQEKEEHLKEINTLMSELERSNQDLQQFANIVSHDLNEPLRTVSNFAQLLGKRYKDKLDEKADTFINFIVDGTSRMQKLLNDLLAFARLGGGQLQMQPLELRSVLNKALANLSDAINNKQAEITYDHELPTITADETQIVQLFQNLLANAIKFSGQEKPVVCISASAGENEWIICIKDNGIGIDPHEHERIFLVFQRLHLRDNYEGSGIGLAQCKKIVERHGGRIWVESTPNQGSSFYFTIPHQTK